MSIRSNRDSQNQFRSSSIIYRLAVAMSLDDISVIISGFLCNIQTLCHASLWGRDDKQECLFLVADFSSRKTIDSSHFIVGYDDKILGHCLRRNTAFSIKMNELDSEQSRDGNSELFITDIRPIDTISYLPLESGESNSSCLFLGFKEPLNARTEGMVEDINLFFHFALQAIERIKTCLFENYLNRVISNNWSLDADSFLQNTCIELKNTFSATSVSIWRVDDELVKVEFFSDPHSAGEPYKLGQGLTGYVAQTGMPIFLHRIADAKRIYEVQWEGLNSGDVPGSGVGAAIFGGVRSGLRPPRRAA